MTAISRWKHLQDLTVASSGTTSEAFSVGDFVQGSIQLPSALTSTAVNYHVSNDGINYAVVMDKTGAALSNATAAADAVIAMPTEVFGFSMCKVVLGSAEAAERTIKLFLGG